MSKNKWIHGNPIGPKNHNLTECMPRSSKSAAELRTEKSQNHKICMGRPCMLLYLLPNPAKKSNTKRRNQAQTNQLDHPQIQPCDIATQICQRYPKCDLQLSVSRDFVQPLRCSVNNHGLVGSSYKSETSKRNEYKVLSGRRRGTDSPQLHFS